MTNFIEDMIEEAFTPKTIKPSGLMAQVESIIGEGRGNMAAAIAGVAGAVALELISPTGSKTSAVVAAVTGGAAVYASRDLINAAPTNGVIATGVACTSLYVGMIGGRVAADYFPGNV